MLKHFYVKFTSRNSVLAVRSLATQPDSDPEHDRQTFQQYNRKLKTDNIDIAHYQQKYPEFVPNPDIKFRNKIREELERQDMLKRRKHVAIPEFYVGTIMAVVTSDVHAPNKTNRFVGICIDRFEYGLRSQFILRNVVDNMGVEIIYNLYSPTIQSIEVLKLEKRLDDQLYYLRDAPNEYSTFPFDLDAEYHPDDAPVPINTIKVPLNDRPWILNYEKMDLIGAIVPTQIPKKEKRAENFKKMREWEKWDLMDEYRRQIPEEEQLKLFSEICGKLRDYEVMQKKEKRKKIFEKHTKKNLF